MYLHQFAAALAAPLALAWAADAAAAERRVQVGSIDKVRLQGPFEVRVTTGPPAVTLVGDAQAVDDVEVRAEGATLILRATMQRWAERPRVTNRVPVTIAVTTPMLTTASVVGAGRLAIASMKAQRVDLSVTGAGAITVAAVAADAASATVIGGGAITLAGRAAKARLMTNGAGSIDADGLDAGDLEIRLDGPGATRARARYAASVINTGLGQVTIAGRPKCTVKAAAGGPVSCGDAN